MVNISTAGWKLEGVEAVIFDKDGTLTDSHQYWKYIIFQRAKAIVEKYNLHKSIASPLCQAMGYSFEEGKLSREGPIALVSRNKVIEVVVRFLAVGYEVYVLDRDIGAIFDEVAEKRKAEMLDNVVLLPGVKACLDTLLKHHVVMGIVTSDSVISAGTALKKVGIGGYFDIVIGRESCDQPKETGMPCLIAAQTLGKSLQSTIVIGDAPVDIHMAYKAGLLAGVGVATGQLHIEDLRGHTDYVVRDLKGLRIEGVNV
jgi:phosphoglycolate phosphatase